MKYWFELLDENYEDTGISIPDSCNKKSAINKAKKRMKECGLKFAILTVNSMRTENLLDTIHIEL